jgi:hypothetical protein
VAKNKRHPQRKEAADFLRRMTVCGARYFIAEIIDDARVGWRGIVVGDDLCVCDHYSSDDEVSLNTNTLMKRPQSTLLVRDFCRG